MCFGLYSIVVKSNANYKCRLHSPMKFIYILREHTVNPTVRGLDHIEPMLVVLQG